MTTEEQIKREEQITELAAIHARRARNVHDKPSAVVHALQKTGELRVYLAAWHDEYSRAGNDIAHACKFIGRDARAIA